MKYMKPELMVLGPASVLVQGGLPGVSDNTSSDKEQAIVGIVLGLDD